MRPSKSMPKSIARIHEPLARTLWVLYAKWNAFKLLCCKADNVRLLDNVASFFFQIVAEMLRDDILLTVCRLTDPKENRLRGGVVKDNLTIDRLVNIVPSSEVHYTESWHGCLRQ